jgi:hypothetical protein
MSIRKPTSLLVVFQVRVVPTFTQNAALLLALEMLAVVDAPSDVRFTSTVQGEEADPHVFAALHSCSGLGSEQAYLPFIDWAATKPVNSGNNSTSDVQVLSMQRSTGYRVHHLLYAHFFSRRLVNARSSFPIDNVYQLPGVRP